MNMGRPVKPGCVLLAADFDLKKVSDRVKIEFVPKKT